MARSSSFSPALARRFMRAAREAGFKQIRMMRPDGTVIEANADAVSGDDLDRELTEWKARHEDQA